MMNLTLHTKKLRDSFYYATTTLLLSVLGEKVLVFIFTDSLAGCLEETRNMGLCIFMVILKLFFHFCFIVKDFMMKL